MTSQGIILYSVGYIVISRLQVPFDHNILMNRSVWEADYVFTVVNGVAVLVCLLAAILVFGFRLYRKVVYRLALYQVLASLAFAMVETLQIVFINYNENPQAYGRVCIAIGWFGMYTRWANLLFTMWVTFHLFCYGVLHKNLDRLEALYLVTSLLVPSGLAVVPVATNTYGRNPFHSYCYINSTVDVAEKLGLWDVPAMVILVVSSIAMVVLMVIIAKLLCRRSRYEPITDGDQFWKAFKELLPLAAYPIVFFFFVIPTVTLHVYSSKPPAPNEALMAAASFSTSLWSMASGTTLIIHLSVARCLAKKTDQAPSLTYSELEQSS